MSNRLTLGESNRLAAGTTASVEDWCLDALADQPDAGSEIRGILSDLTVVVPSRCRQDYLLRQLLFWHSSSAKLVIVDGSTLRVSSILSWFNDDFVDQYARLIDADRPSRDRTILGVIAKYGPPEASRLAQTGTARIRFLKYDWSLNDTATN